MSEHFMVFVETLNYCKERCMMTLPRYESGTKEINSDLPKGEVRLPVRIPSLGSVPDASQDEDNGRGFVLLFLFGDRRCRVKRLFDDEDLMRGACLQKRKQIILGHGGMMVTCASSVTSLSRAYVMCN
eukprot:CAMPEP_0194066468 /NCGR_PEP_ID=MMETSP0009_2-20130614/86040_1 /TAXON_ID=210454 /ORGANISM="Grammatophora oceanica, Strain CCMP 410" /LENGTH=127 /DNA_ID=CAMNT_0038719427 /DNA_START=1317 /DNA_END=1697 /DNA_ORIENTATION=-